SLKAPRFFCIKKREYSLHRSRVFCKKFKKFHPATIGIEKIMVVLSKYSLDDIWCDKLYN
ncbi:MAG: hypothetical protein LIO96_02855, partial [Lachnospiraceae bacterium]|nr:hypothetical protein [Lachnospiraceae bacterium]